MDWKKLRIKTVELSIIAIVGAFLFFLAGMIDESTMLAITGFFGAANLAALRSLFLSYGMKTYVVFIAGSILLAIFAFGYVQGYGWAEIGKIRWLVGIILGLEGVTTAHGIAKANGKSEIGV